MKKSILALFIFSSLFSSAQNPLVKMWDKRFGGNAQDILTCFIQTDDNGFLLGGLSGSDSSGDKTENMRGNHEDYWIVKIDSAGNKQWDKTFGGISGSSGDWLHSIDQTYDGGYILGGYSYSAAGGDKTQDTWGGFGDADYWIVKTDAQGIKLWDTDVGGTSGDFLYAVRQTSDGGYILGGFSSSTVSGDKSQSTWGFYSVDYWIVTVDSLGNKMWDRDFGGTDSDFLYSVEQTSDGGFILAGYSNSGIGGNKTEASYGSYDYWIIKTDYAGFMQWNKTHGGSGSDFPYSIIQRPAGGYVVTGSSSSGISGDKSENTWGGGTDKDYWILRMTSLGEIFWDKDLGGNDSECEFSAFGMNQFPPGNVISTLDGGYLVSGASHSYATGNKSENNLGPQQGWLVKLNASGQKLWDKTIFTTAEDESAFVVQTSDGCYAVATSTAAGIGGYKSQDSWDTAHFLTDYWIVKFCDSTFFTSLSKPEFKDPSLSLFPDPAGDQFTISNFQASLESIEIFNSIGERVYSSDVNCASCIVHCESFRPGIYFVKAISGSEILSGKIIKQ
jgi:hypothetical protein